MGHLMKYSVSMVEEKYCSILGSEIEGGSALLLEVERRIIKCVLHVLSLLRS
jgi:hypothetical protein